jgi:outer membrane protein
MLYKQIEAMFEAGNRPKSDLYDQMATVKNNELLVLRSKNTMTNDKSKLAITLQLDPTVDLNLEAPGWDLDGILSAMYNLDELYDISLANRPDLKQFQSAETASEKSINVARANCIPGLYAFYNVNTRYNNLSSRGLEEQLMTDNRGSRYGLSMNIPIYSGLRNRTFYIRQKVNYENSKINTENLKKTILNDVRNAYQNYVDVKAAYEVSIAQSEAAEMSLKVQQERYKLGIGSLIELTNANNKYVLAASGFAQAKLNLLFQKVILDYYTGTLQVPQE